MAIASGAEITKLLHSFRSGDQQAQEQLLLAVHKELRKMARYHMSRQGQGHVLQTTALVNEFYLRLAKQQDLRWLNRAHFFAVAAKAMRDILVDYARRANAGKRGGELHQIPLHGGVVYSDEKASEILAVNEALDSLASLHPVQAKVVELKYFSGLTDAEIATFLDLAERTVQKYLRLAKAWLKTELKPREL
jgi:RNA polymerase sigma-70 factor (ECF subfamily)